MRTKSLMMILILLALIIPAAPVHAGGDVTVCDEAHLKAALASGGSVTFLCSGTITLTQTITVLPGTTIDGSGQAVTISGGNAVPLFIVNDPYTGSYFTLRELTIANGFEASGTGTGGVSTTGVDLNIHHVTFTGNRGSAIRFSAGSRSYATLSAVNTTFTGNNASYGGAIYNLGGRLVIDHSTYSGNSASNGGAIYSDNGSLSISNSTFSANAADSADGAGGVIFNQNGSLSVSECTFSGNRAAHGGAIFTHGGGPLTVVNSFFSGNSAKTGAGIFHNVDPLTVKGSTFSGNSAEEYYGGGIYAWAADTNATDFIVSNSTFYDNSAPRGGGIYNEGFAQTVSNSTFSGNSSALGASIMSIFSTTRLQNTIIANSGFGNNCMGFFIDGGGNLSYPDNSCFGANLNPVLGPLQNNGGFTPTMLLGNGSAAIDTGNDATCAGAPVNGLDQRGVARPQGPHCDIGAVEMLPAAIYSFSIDIKPGGEPNSVNCRNANQVIAVAILTTDSFDATNVDHTSVTFEGAVETHLDQQTGEPIRHAHDVDGDGDSDLVFHFRLGDTYLTCTSTQAALWGQTFAGEPFMGVDWVRMVGGD